MPERTRKDRPATLAVHAGVKPDPRTGAVMTPIYASSTFAQTSPGVHTGYEYARTGNPTRAAFEAAVAELEGGVAGFAFASGLAAQATLLELLDQGSRITAVDDLYGGSWRLFERVRKRSAGHIVTYADPTNLDAFEAAIGPKTNMIWVESPTNPSLKVADLAAIAAIGKARGILTVADSTFASPMIQRPLELGFDIVLHSATKYLNGHSDVTGGAVAGSRALLQRVDLMRRYLGGVMDPQAAYDLARGLKTLTVRVACHNRSAEVVARFLDNDPRVVRVFYPGLASHPDHDVARAQMTGFGGMVTFEVADGLAGASRVFDRLGVIRRATSLGCVNSLASLPVLTSHYNYSDDDLARAGVTAGMLRVSVGLEDEADLIADLDQALG